MDRAHSLIAFASRWHACTGDVPPPLVGASITFVEVPVPRSRHTRSGQQQQQPEHPSKSSSSGGSAAGASRSTSTGTSSSSAASCTLSPRLYIFGGRLVSTRRMVADIWYLDLHTLKWTRIAGQSSADSRQSQDSDPRAKHDDAISPDEKSPTRRAKTVPSPRYFHSADAWDNKLIIYGGMGYLPAGTARPNQLVADTSSAAEAGTGATSGRAPGQPDEELCVLDDLIAFDLIRNEWDINFGKPVAAAASSSSTPPTPSHTAFWPSARYAHLSSVSSEFLIVLGGQNATNGYIARIDVFHLPSRVWVGYQPFQKQCGGYRSLVAAPKLVVSHSTRAPILDVEHAHRLANTAAQAATGPSTFRPLRSQSNASEAWGGSVGTAVESAPYDSRDVDRHRSDSTASRPSVLSVSSGTGGVGTTLTLSPSSPHPGSGSVQDGASFRSGAGASESAGSLFRTGANLAISGLTGNPAHASSANLSIHSHAGSSVLGQSQMGSEDGGSATAAALRAEYAAAMANELSQPPIPTYGVSSSHPIVPKSLIGPAVPRRAPTEGAPAEVNEPADGPTTTVFRPAPSLYLYSNYHFTDVKREIEVMTLEMRKNGEAAPAAAAAEGASERPPGQVNMRGSDVSIHFKEMSSAMRGNMLPPGLRFPTGAVVGENLIVCGTYLANTSQSFSIWSLHLPTLVWTRIDIGSVLSTGSWNRAIVWPGDPALASEPGQGQGQGQSGSRGRHGHSQSGSGNSSNPGTGAGATAGESGPGDVAAGLDADSDEDEEGLLRKRPAFAGNKLIILGHRGRDLVNDYNHRQVNCDHVIIVDLETWGIYQPPMSPFPSSHGVLARAAKAQAAAQFPGVPHQEWRTGLPSASSMAVELGLAKLRSSAQGGLVPIDFPPFSEKQGGTGSSEGPGAAGAQNTAASTNVAGWSQNRHLQATLLPGVNRLRSDSSATTSSAGSGGSSGRHQRVIGGVPRAASSAADSIVAEQLGSAGEAGAEGDQQAMKELADGPGDGAKTPDAGIGSPAAAPATTAPASAERLPFAPFSFGGRGDFEIVCSDGLWIGCDRVVLERRWPWFAERMREYRKRAKRFAASPLVGGGGGNAQSSFAQPHNAMTNPERDEDVVDPAMQQRRPSLSGTEDAAAATGATGPVGAGSAPGSAVSAASKDAAKDGNQPAAGGGLSLSRRSPDPRVTPRQMVFPDSSPVVLALLEFLYTRSICTALQRHPVIVSALLVFGTTYELRDLVQLCIHAAHGLLSTELSVPTPESKQLSRNATPTSSSLAAFAAAKAGSALGGAGGVGANAVKADDAYIGSAVNAYDPVRNDLTLEQRHRNAVLIFEAATLSGADALSIRALRLVLSINKIAAARGQPIEHRRRGGWESSAQGGGDVSVDQSSRMENGRMRASTTASSVSYPRQTNAYSATAQSTYQHLRTVEGRASLDEGSDYGHNTQQQYSNPGSSGIAGSGVGKSVAPGPAAGSGYATNRPRATTNPSKADMSGGRGTIGGGGGPQYAPRGGLGGSAALGSTGQPQQSLGPNPGVGPSSGPPSAASRIAAAAGKKRFSIFGRTNVPPAAAPAGGTHPNSPRRSPSNSNIDVSAINNTGAANDASELGYRSGEGQPGRAGEEGGHGSAGHASAPTNLRVDTGEYQAARAGGIAASDMGGAQHGRQMGTNAPSSQSQRYGGAAGGPQYSAAAPGPAGVPGGADPSSAPQSALRSQPQGRMIRGVSNPIAPGPASTSSSTTAAAAGAARAPRGSAGPLTSGGPAPAPAPAAGGPGGSGRDDGARRAASGNDSPHGPPGGLVARLVREREASGGS